MCILRGRRLAFAGGKREEYDVAIDVRTFGSAKSEKSSCHGDYRAFEGAKKEISKGERRAMLYTTVTIILMLVCVLLVPICTGTECEGQDSYLPWEEQRGGNVAGRLTFSRYVDAGV